MSSPPSFSVSINSGETAHVVRVVGELDVATQEQLASALEPLPKPPNIVVLDAAELTFVDSTGLGVFLTEHQRARAEGYEFVIAGASQPIREILRVTALDLTLPLAPDVASVVDD